ncbi:unnamed protein product [Diamesa tonsa]
MTKEEIEDFEGKVAILENWIKDHETLPENIANILVRRFLHSVCGDLEKAKRLIELHYKMRFKNPNIFRHRDFAAPGIQHMLKVIDVVPILITGNHKMIITRLNDVNPDNFEYDNLVRSFFIGTDVFLRRTDDSLPNRIHEGDIPIYDMSGYSLKHLTKITLSTMRSYMKFTQEAMPVKLKQIHLINVSPLTNKFLTLARPFINSEVREMLKLHAPNSTTLFDYIPQDILPEEYGGKGGTLADMKTKWIEEIESNRDFLMDERNWRSRKDTKPKN